MDVVELVPSRLFVLGGRITLDAGVSWAPEETWGSSQPINCYLLREGDASLIIDPGLACQDDLVLEQLASVLAPGSAVSVYVTRAEFDTFGSLGRLGESYKIERVYAGGATNPFDGFDNLTEVDPSRNSEYMRLARVPAGTEMPINGERVVTVIRPTLRLLPTYWLFDALTRTLFTSDAFTHTATADDTESRVMDDASGCDVDTVSQHLFAKFWWLPHAKAEITMVASDLRVIFDTYSVGRIAPCRGRVIDGQEAVSEHYQLVQDVLTRIATA